MIDNQSFEYVRPSALLGYEIIPNLSNISPPSNSYGLIGKEYKLNKEKNIFRILLLGDSIAFKDSARKSLEEKLNKNPSLNEKYKFEIWNAGCPSYDVRRYYFYLKHRGLNYNPDMVMVFLFMNDFGVNINVYYKDKNGTTECYFPIPEISKRHGVSPFLMKYSSLYRFIILRLDSYLLSRKKAGGVNILEENGKYYLEAINKICDKNKIPLFIAIFPYLKPLSEYKDWQFNEYKTILETVRGLKLEHLNLYDHLPKEDLRSLRGRKEDEIHPSEEGDYLIADIIYQHLLKSHFND